MGAKMKLLSKITLSTLLAFATAAHGDSSPLAKDGALTFDEFVFPGKIHKVVRIDDMDSPVKIIDAKLFRPIESFGLTGKNKEAFDWDSSDHVDCILNGFTNASLVLDVELSSSDFASINMMLFLYDSRGEVERFAFNLISNEPTSSHIRFPTGGPIDRPNFHTMGGGILFVTSVIYKDGTIWEANFQNTSPVGLSKPLSNPIPYPSSFTTQTNEATICAYQVSNIP